MVLLAHVIIALSSIAVSSYAFLRPSNTILRLSYGLVASTLATGTYLVVSTHSPLLGACVSGLFYIIAVSFVIIPARNKLVKNENASD